MWSMSLCNSGRGWISWRINGCMHRPLARYVKLRVAHAPGMPGTFSPPPRVIDSNMHHGTCVNMPWCMPGSLTSSFFWSWWRGKRSQHSWRMCNPQFYVSGKRPMDGWVAEWKGEYIMNIFIMDGWEWLDEWMDGWVVEREADWVHG